MRLEFSELFLDSPSSDFNLILPTITSKTNHSFDMIGKFWIGYFSVFSHIIFEECWYFGDLSLSRFEGSKSKSLTVFMEN